jgi:SAM-dependent methyltransferase
MVKMSARRADRGYDLPTMAGSSPTQGSSMSNPQLAHAGGNQLKVPEELAEDLRRLGTPLVVRALENGDLFIDPPEFRGSLPRRIVRGARGQRQTVGTLDGEVLNLRTALVPQGSYHIVSYSPRYLLMPVEEQPAEEASSRASFWRQQHGYAEHRPAEEQGRDVNEVSRWLAHDVIAPLAPRSVLELGCGAGRNLRHLREALPQARILGLEINRGAAEVAGKVPDVDIHVRSLYEARDLGPVDVMLTAGVLMHIPHDRAPQVVASMVEQSEIATVHLELHGKPRGFDFHRYPRDYAELYRSLGHQITYQVLDPDDPRNRGESTGQLALAVWRPLQ